MSLERRVSQLEPLPEIGPVTSIEDLNEILELQPELESLFEPVASTEKDLWTRLQHELTRYDPEHRLYRGIPIEDALALMEGTPLTIEPYDGAENASFRYQNTYGYGTSRSAEHEGTTMIGFKSDGFKIARGTVSENQDNLSISGTLDPQNVDFMVWRFPKEHAPGNQQFEFKYFLARRLLDKKRKNSPPSMEESSSHAA